MYRASLAHHGYAAELWDTRLYLSIPSLISKPISMFDPPIH